MRISTVRRLARTPAALLLVAATTFACHGSAPSDTHAAGPSPSPATRQRTYFPQYGVASRAYRPRRLDASVDGSFYVRGMHWTTWDERAAVGSGIAQVDDCRPDCADGHYTAYRVTVRLSAPQDLCGSRFFTTIRVRGSGYHTYGHRSGVGCQ